MDHAKAVTHTLPVLTGSLTGSGPPFPDTLSVQDPTCNILQYRGDWPHWMLTRLGLIRLPLGSGGVAPAKDLSHLGSPTLDSHCAITDRSLRNLCAQLLGLDFSFASLSWISIEEGPVCGLLTGIFPGLKVLGFVVFSFGSVLQSLQKSGQSPDPFPGSGGANIWHAIIIADVASCSCFPSAAAPARSLSPFQRGIVSLECSHAPTDTDITLKSDRISACSAVFSNDGSC